MALPAAIDRQNSEVEGVISRLNNLRLVTDEGHPSKGEKIVVRHQIKGTQNESGYVIGDGCQVVG